MMLDRVRADLPFMGPRGRSPRRDSDGDEAAGPRGEPASPRSPGGYRPWGCSSRSRNTLANGSSSSLGSGTVRSGFTTHPAPIRFAEDMWESTSGGGNSPMSWTGPDEARPSFSPMPRVDDSPVKVSLRARRGVQGLTLGAPRTPGGQSSASSCSLPALEHSVSLRTRRGIGGLTLSAAKESSTPPQEESPQVSPAGINKDEPKTVGMRKVKTAELMSEVINPAVQLVGRGRSQRRLDQDDISDGDGCVVPAIRRPFPGAFSERRAIIFFDWDDTLCPTTFIRSLLKDTLADREEWRIDELETLSCPEMDWRDQIPAWFNHPLPDEPSLTKHISDLQQAVINVIKVAQAIGVVCIVTNAIPGWVEKTLKKWLPLLKQYIFGHCAQPPIKVLYGQRSYKKMYKVAASIKDLPWFDELGEYMWWKQAAMNEALDDVERLYRLEGKTDAEMEACPSWFRSGDSKRITNIISIGDNEAEMQSAELTGLLYNKRRKANACWHPPLAKPKRKRRGAAPEDTDSGIISTEDTIENTPKGGKVPKKKVAAVPRSRKYSRSVPVEEMRRSHWPWVKLFKFKECPHVKHLCRQLEELAELLPQAVHLRHDIRVDCREFTSPKSPSACLNYLGCNAADLQVEQKLRVQTV